nr:methylated-DNA--[protein]-cysteine S-methyltransferase [Cardiobacterium hominis]
MPGFFKSAGKGSLKTKPMTTAEQIQFARIAAAIEFLYDHHREQPDLAAVAAHVHISPQHLQRQFQQWAGISPKKMLQHISIENAKRILHAQGSVQDAALDSGLSGTGRLHDLFVAIEGMTPGEYKNGGAGLQIDWQLVASPYGSVLVANTAKGICFLSFADDPAAESARLRALFPNAELRNTATKMQAQALSALQQPPQQPIALHIKGTPFQLKVWQALLNIPCGQLADYGTLARRIGHPNACRAVGTAVGSNPVAVLIPCHRVIRQTGMLGGYRWHRGRKIALLGKELEQA